MMPSEQASLPEAHQSDPFVRAYPENAQFWAWAERGRLCLPRCTACGRFHWYPRIVCPFCHGSKVQWSGISGDAVVYTFSVIRATTGPFLLAYVQLAEGPMLMTNLVDCEVDHAHIGMKVKVKFVRTEEGRLAPAFSPQT